MISVIGSSPSVVLTSSLQSATHMTVLKSHIVGTAASSELAFPCRRAGYVIARGLGRCVECGLVVVLKKRCYYLYHELLNGESMMLRLSVCRAYAPNEISFTICRMKPA